MEKEDDDNGRVVRASSFLPFLQVQDGRTEKAATAKCGRREEHLEQPPFGEKIEGEPLNGMLRLPLKDRKFCIIHTLCFVPSVMMW